MSYVTDTILTFGAGEEEDAAIDEVNEVLRVKGQTVQAFVLTSAHRPQKDVSGGCKHLQVSVAMAAFNYVSDDVLVAAVRSHKWWNSDAVRLFVHRENDECGFSELEWRPDQLAQGARMRRPYQTSRRKP